MTAIRLMRDALVRYYSDTKDALRDDAKEAHPGLLIQRGYASHERETDAGREAKTMHVRRICDIPASAFYQNAYQRWRKATRNELRFRQLDLALESRLFIGLTGGGMLETGCAISHSYGVPYIPGSSLKGVVRAHVHQTPFAQEHPQVVAELFGAAGEPDGPHSDGLSGLVVFHDAWWVPGSADTPLVEEVVTSHHLAYYGQDGAVSASDFDDPTPNAQIAARGRFLFVLEGEPAWRDLAEEMLVSALSRRGIGARTASGHGLFSPEPKRATCAWVDEAIAELVAEHNTTPQTALLGKALAEKWSALDGELKVEALADIRARWEALDQWEAPRGKAGKNAKRIYTGEV